MQEKTKFTLIAAAVALVFVLFNSLYILPQTEQAIVLQFGEPVRLVKEPGLKFKVPFIQNVVFYDNRLLNLDPPAQEIVLNDKKRLDVDSFTRFRIIDPLKFYQTVRTEEQARSKLKEIVNSSVRKILGRTTCRNCFRKSGHKSCRIFPPPSKPMPSRLVSAWLTSASDVPICRLRSCRQLTPA